KKVSPWWQIDGRGLENRSDDSDCIIGKRVAKQLGIREGDIITIAYNNADREQGPADTPEKNQTGAESPAKASAGQKRSNGSIDPALSGSRQFTVSGIVTTGADEDNQIFASLRAAQKLAGLEGRVSAIAVSAIGGSEQIERLSQDIAAQSG